MLLFCWTEIEILVEVYIICLSCLFNDVFGEGIVRCYFCVFDGL